MLCCFVGVLAVAWSAAPAPAQPAFSNAVSLGTVSLAGLVEASGVVASRQNEGVLWTHNDSGDMARLFALDTQGRLLGIYKLSHAVNYDYEDIAIGPGPVANVAYLHVGDIGDNFTERSSITIYQFPEPAVYLRQAARPPTVNVPAFRTLQIFYPDGAHNAETLLVDPWGGDVFIASKEANVSRIYTATKAQMDAGGPITLSFVRQIDFDLATGGDISPTGREIILRRENSARLWTRAPGQSVEDAFRGAGVPIPVVGQPIEYKGEAISFDSMGRGYFTLSDGAATQPLYYFGRSSPDAPPPSRALVAAGSTWRYLDTGTNLGVAWRTVGFNDSAWKAGDGPFGYGDGDEQTTVGFGPRAASKFVTTYFRKAFVVTNALIVSRLDLRLLFDDGAAAYLNGRLIALANLRSNATATNLASATQEDLENTWSTFAVDPASLNAGTNTLAIEVHQAAVNSPDLGFDAQLLAFESSPLRILTAAHLSDGTFHVTFTASDAVLTVEASTDLILWSALGTALLTNGVGSFSDVAPATMQRRFYRLSQ